MEKTVKLFPQQFDAINFETQFAAAVAGVQSGKTFVGSHWMGVRVSENPGGTYLIAAPTYKILQQATLQKFFQIFPQLRAYYKEQKGEISLPGGGVVFIRSADAPLSMEGISPNAWWLDEGGMTSSLTWTVLRSRVSMSRGKGFITTTPYNMGWLYQQFYQPWKAGDKDLSFFTWPSIANPKFPKEFYESEKKRLPEEEFSRRYMGEFRKMSGLIYDLPDSQIIEPQDLGPKAEARLMGIDWGFRNPAAIISVMFYEGSYYITDEWKHSEKTTQEIVQIANNKVREQRITRAYPDPAEPDRLEEARRLGIPVYPANKDVLGGINFIRSLIHEKRLFVFNTCQETLNEMSMYHWADTAATERDPKEEPQKFNDHLMDAMRYAIYSYKPAPRVVIPQQTQTKRYYPEIGI